MTISRIEDSIMNNENQNQETRNKKIKREFTLEDAKAKYCRIVHKVIGNISCPDHNKAPEIIINGNTFSDISYSIDGCCPKVIELAKNRIEKYSKITDEKDFIEKIKEVDTELSKLNIPIYKRPLLVPPMIAPCEQSVIGGFIISKKLFPEYSGPNLMDHISKWYTEQYGDRVLLPTDIGKIPLLIRNEIFFARIPLVYGKVKIYFLKMIEGITAKMIKELTPDELSMITQKYSIGYNLFYEIDGLRSALRNNISMQADTAKYLLSALSDIETAISDMKNAKTLNNSCYHSQQAAEKILKSCLVEKGGFPEKKLKSKEYGHNVGALFKAVKKLNDCFEEKYSSDIDILNSIKMDIRYEGKKITNEYTVNIFWSSLSICGLCACFILGRERSH